MTSREVVHFLSSEMTLYRQQTNTGRKNRRHGSRSRCCKSWLFQGTLLHQLFNLKWWRWWWWWTCLMTLVEDNSFLLVCSLKIDLEPVLSLLNCYLCQLRRWSKNNVSTCPSICPSVCFYSIVWTDWPFNMILYVYESWPKLAWDRRSRSLVNLKG